MALTLRAIYLAEQLDLDRASQALTGARGKSERAKRVALAEVHRHRNRSFYRLDDDRYVVLYAFGVAVFLGATVDEEKAILSALRSALVGPEPKGWSDEYAVEVDPSLPKDTIVFDRVRVRTLSLDAIGVITRVLAQSVSISQFDITVDRMVEEYRRVYDELRKGGELRVRPRALLTTIGANHEILRAIIADLALLNAPLVTWRDAALEALWTDLREHFDLEDRFERLEFKLGFLRESTDQLLGIIQARRAEVLELVIILLFIIDLIVLGVELWK